MISALISRLIILSFGTLYPAYASYKAVRTKSVKEYVKWMMYWIVYAFFTCFETVTDIFFSWFPFYYEIKVIIVLWLLSPATKGSSTLYRKFVHPALARHEQNIDEYLNQAKERGYTAVVQLGAKGVNYATNLVMQTAIKTLHYGFRGVAVNVQPQQQLPGYVMSSLSSSSTNFIDSNTNTNDDHNSGDNYDMTDFMFVSRRPEAFVEFSDEDDEFNLILHPPHPVLPRQQQQQQQTVSHTNLLENHSYNDNNERDNYGNYNTNEGVRSADDNDVDVDDGATIVGGSDGRVILTRKAKEKSRNNRVSKTQNPSAAADYPAAGRRTRGRRKLRHIDVFANEYDMDVDVEH